MEDGNHKASTVAVDDVLKPQQVLLQIAGMLCKAFDGDRRENDTVRRQASSNCAAHNKMIFVFMHAQPTSCRRAEKRESVCLMRDFSSRERTVVVQRWYFEVGQTADTGRIPEYVFPTY